jgi:hypothetical protein
MTLPSWRRGPVAPEPSTDSVVGWIVDGALDAPLAACVWLLAEGGVPVVVAGPERVTAERLADVLGAFGRPPVLLDAFPRSLEAASLEDVQARLAEAPYDLTEDAIRSVGVVLVVRVLSDGRRRVVAAHYVRPLEQDPRGHVQRRPPALLAAWDAEEDRFDDFAWGISAELAGRVGREPAAFERARDDRASLLARLASTGVVGREAVAQALQAASLTPERLH